MRFSKILIANRGEIASRIIRTAHSMGLSTVAIYADPDRDAPFVREADEAYYIGPPVASGSFLAIDRIADIAVECGADAVHPGYGFLAENRDFALACEQRNVVFIGPSPDVIAQMGNKTEAKQAALAAGVPVIPGFSARDLDTEEIVARADEVGFPLMIKAAYGGGGKGMRIVRDIDGLRPALESAAREAAASFGRDELLLERYITHPRHVEVQILGDTQGRVIHCFERECSIQRRHQKVVEEAPSPTIRGATREAMTSAAVALGQALGYVNAGTVEFVVGEDDSFFFLEVNTRLQVEHPVTEEVTGLDLVRLQIEIAQGDPLPVEQDDIECWGHAIEVRVCAEDPDNDFLPAIGPIHRWEPAPIDGVRYEVGIDTGSEVTIHYDPMLAKIIGYAGTRDEAADRLAKALHASRLDGVTTNLGFLERVLRHQDFRDARLDTGFLERNADLAKAPAEQAETDRIHAKALALWLQAERRRNAVVLAGLPSGWRNNPTQFQSIQFKAGGEEIEVLYQAAGPNFRVQIAGTDALLEARIVGASDDDIDMELGTRRRRFTVTAADGAWFVQSALGRSRLAEVPRFSSGDADETHGGCQASMPGKILKVLVATGDSVEKGDVLVVMEAMKMEHEITAPSSGTVGDVMVAVGDQVDAGQVLVAVDDGTDGGTE